MKETLSKRELGLREAGKRYGKATEEALRKYLANIGNEYYIWLSDLYEPRKCICDNFDEDGCRICLHPKDENGEPLCTGGGFYYCNSARDTEGYDIDIESTAQACGFIAGTGLLDNYDRNYKKAFPKQMQKDILAFAKSLQYSDDGYFYHPKWKKDITPSRLGRDLGWATGLIKSLGDVPFYDTKNGHKGSLGAPTGAVLEEGGEASQNSTWVPHLKDLDAFKEYLASFDLATRSYSAGNMMNAQTSQYKARDAKAMEDGEAHDNNGDGIAEDGFIAYFEKFFNEKQNPENGLWEDVVHYNGVNGLMKLSTSYNALGLKLNYAKAAFKSALEIALLPAGVADVKGKYATGSVDVFNPWVAFQAILANVKKFGTEEEYTELQKMLADNSAELVEVSREKAAKFKKPDGSFGYTWSCPPHKSQGAPVCPEGFIEGDVNGGGIATNGIWRNICATLELTIPIFSPEDGEILLDRIKKRCGYN